MNDRIPTWVYDIAHTVSKIPFAKSLLKPIYYPYKERIKKRRQVNFKKNALEVLRVFDECMSVNGYEYTLIFGTLLGAIREKGFISHDCDIDVAVFSESRCKELSQVLLNNGFILSRRFTIDDGLLGCEETYLYKDTGVSIDIFFIYPPIDKYPYVCCWNYGKGCATYRETMRRYGGVTPRRIELPITYEIDRVSFENIMVNIPRNAHEISAFSYGPNYMVPDPNFIPPTEHRVIWNEKKAIYEEFNQ